MGEFGIKDLYEATLRTNEPMNINGTEYEADECILRFKNIQLAGIGTSKQRTRAEGGYGNKTHIMWEDNKPLQMQIQQGVLNKKGLSILTNNELVSTTETVVPIHLILQNKIASELKYKLKKEIKISEPYFLYTNDGKKLKKDDDYIINNDNELEILLPQQETVNIENFIFDYYTVSERAEILKVGKNLINRPLKFEGKTRVKDDIDGQIKTGIITIPEVRLMSDLSIRLGDEIEPFVYGFSLEGEPVGMRNDTYVYEFTFLDENLEADI